MKVNFLRSLVHISMVGFALFIGRIPAWAISLAAVSAFIFNLFLLPKIAGQKLARDNESGRLGLLLYPSVLTLISLVFYHQQIFMAVAWGSMAFGDAFAAISGNILKGPVWPWNNEKRLSGSLGFFIFGSTFTLILISLLPRHLYFELCFQEWIPIILISVFVAAWIESLPGLVNDNLSVPLFTAATAFFLKEAYIYGSFYFPVNLPIGLFLTICFMALSWAIGKIDLIGTITGGILAFLIFLGGGFPAMGLLLLFFVGGTAVSMWKRKEKKAEGLAQENEGKRSINNALANAGIAGFCGACAWIFHPQQELFLLMLMASIASALGDTMASELGNLYGKRYINILSFKADQRGNDGAISLEGSFAGLIGCVIIVLGFTLTQGSLLKGTELAILGGFLGVMVDSALGASLQRKGYLNNDTVNFSMTLFSALFAGGLYLLIY
ncbi:MAG: DUF92 domain-containing protein [Bacteroidia bacterium]|nr:DUF92 domain-containing protein [Bacteroidia bacterium]